MTDPLDALIDATPGAAKAGKARAPKAEKAKKPGSLKEAGLESYEAREIHRGDLKNADYNPRVIGDGERKKLQAALKQHGLVAPITFNRRTGNIVGGHQRISIMDALMRTADYRLTVAEIDVPLAREKELNVLLNNQQAMGSWDMAGLKAIMSDEAVTLTGAGLDITDMIQMFGDQSLNDRQDDLAELAGRLGELTSHYTKIQHANKKKATGEFYLVFVFPDSEHVDALIAHAKLRDNRYQSGKQLMEMLGVNVEAYRAEQAAEEGEA